MKVGVICEFSGAVRDAFIRRGQVARWENQTPGGQNKLGPSPDRWKIRSKTYQGIADAMAEQWGSIT